MITPVIINRLQWKAYLIFMCTNFAFVPLVYYCYPETANLTLEEIDFLFIEPDKSAVKVSKEIREARRTGGHRQSIVTDTGIRRRTSAVDSAREKKSADNFSAQHIEAV